jgi:hypothetical protein
MPHPGAIRLSQDRCGELGFPKSVSKRKTGDREASDRRLLARNCTNHSIYETANDVLLDNSLPGKL